MVFYPLTKKQKMEAEGIKRAAAAQIYAYTRAKKNKRELRHHTSTEAKGKRKREDIHACPRNNIHAGGSDGRQSPTPSYNTEE